MKTWYKVNYFVEWWNIRNACPWMHIEEIAEILDDIIVGGRFWYKYEKKEARIDWENENQVTVYGTINKLPKYLKCENNGVIYYFYLSGKPESTTVDKNGDIVFKGTYLQDRYMTKYNYKLHLIYDKNILVDFMSIYQDKFHKNGEKWELDIVKNKYLSNYYTTNNQLVRSECFHTNEETLWDINFGGWITEGETIHRNVGTETWTISFNDLQNYLRTPNNTGRFRYIVCQPSSIVKTENQKFLSTDTKQCILVIPLFKDLVDEILHATNDISITSSQNGAINPFGGNFIGYWESDLPFSFVYGMYKNSDGEISLKYAQNKTNDNTDHKVLYFEIPCNYDNKFKLLDYSAYANGFFGKISYMINNADKWNPDTEPSMLAPQYYQEVYDNGMGRIVNDLSKFKFTWNAETLRIIKKLQERIGKDKKYLKENKLTKEEQNVADDLSLFMTIMFDEQLFLGINHGDLTNTALISFDNTNIDLTSISIRNNLINSAASNYYAQGVNQGLTSVQNRESEQRQSWTQFGLNTASSLTSGNGDSVSGAIGTVIGAITNPIGTLIKGASSIFGIFSKLAQVRAENERKNRELKSNINNMYSSPSQNRGQPFLKGIKSNNGKLIQFYKFELHPYDRVKVFSNLLNIGYPYDTKDKIQIFRNRKYMNVLNIDSNNSYDKILNCLIKYDNSNFTTQLDWEEFITWLNGPKHIYETIYPINVTDWQAEDYIDNVEKKLPPMLRTNIEDVLTNIPKRVRAEKSLLIEDLKQAHPSIPRGDLLWEVLEIVEQRYDLLILKVRENEIYTGTIVKNCINYNAYCDIDDEKHYVFDFNKVFTAGEVVFEDKWRISGEVFNYPVYFNNLSSITTTDAGFFSFYGGFMQPLTLPNNIKEIGNGFLRNCAYFNQPLTLPNSTEKIGQYFMTGCEHFNQPLTLPNSIKEIDRHFMAGCQYFNQPLTLPNSLTSIGAGFLEMSKNMISQVNIQDLQAGVFYENPYTLSTNEKSAPAYQRGIEIVGTHKAEFLTRFPNSDVSPYRKLR